MTGPNADEIYCQLGTIPAGAAGSGVTVRRGLEQWAAGTPVQVAYAPGCPAFGSDPDLMEQAVEAAREADVIVAVLGGTSSRFGGGEFHNNGALKAQDMATMDCGENVDTSRLELPGDQLTLLAQLKDTGKPVVTVLIQGAALCHGGGDGPPDALFCCFYPGLTGGEALAQLSSARRLRRAVCRYPCRIMWDSCQCTTTIRIPTGAWIITTPGSAPRSPLAAV